MFKQNEVFFPRDINRAGCCFFSLLAACEIEAGACLTKEQILEIYNLGTATKFVDWQNNTRTWIEKNCSVVNPDAIAQAALKLLGSTKKIRQVGAIDKAGVRTFWSWANKAPYNNPNYILLEFPIHGEFSGHYVLADMSKRILFDPSIHDYTQQAYKGGLLYTIL